MTRSSTHHVDRKNCVSRKKELPVDEHARIHFDEFMASGSIDAFNGFLGQFGNMTPDEKQRYYDNLEKSTGIKIRFY